MRQERPCEILKPTLDAIDDLRCALDRAYEETNEAAVAVLLDSITELAAAAHRIEDGGMTDQADSKKRPFI